MKKKKLIKWIIIGLFIGIIIPVPRTLKDGGTVVYKATSYQVIKLHRLNFWNENGFDTGTIVKILGIEVYNSLKKNDVSLRELERINDELLLKVHDYPNFVSSYVDEYRKEIVIGLKDDSVEEITWFKENISDSDYLSFVKIGDSEVNVLYMYIQEQTLTNTGATIVIDDIGSEDYLFDSSFQIERLDGDNWVSLSYLDKEPNWEEYPFSVKDHGIIQEISWKDIYGELPKGTYRLIKKVIISDTQEESLVRTEFNLY